MYRNLRKGILALSIVFCSVAVQAQDDTFDEIQKMGRVIDLIDKMYVDSVDIHDLVEKSIIKTLEELDPHSVYISKEDYEEMNAPLNGSFSGVGIRFQILKDTIMVVQTIPGGPSEKVGVRAGDKFFRIDGELVAGQGVKNTGVRDRLLGDKGTKVEVDVLRKGEQDPIHFTITRDKIPINSLDAAYLVTPEIGYVKLNNFSRTTVEEFKTAVKQLKKDGMKDLIIDLQGNGGGYLSTAIELADEILSDDKLIVYTEGVSSPKRTYNAKHEGLFENGRLIVLVDESSASASEILAGAVQDWDRGLIMGRRSFGKGLVQNQLRLTDGSWMRLTTSRYYTPTGRSIQKPYEDGHDAYRAEKYERFASGEAFHIDSIKIADSLTFKTLVKKRNVYGGGGIIPDVFVPIDTTQSSAYSSALIRTGAMSQFALEYVNDNRSEISTKFPTFEAFKTGFDISSTTIELTKYAEKDGLDFAEEDFNKAKSLIEIRLKALIAQNLWNSSKFYEVITPLNESLLEAVKVLESNAYNKMDLSKK